MKRRLSIGFVLFICSSILWANDYEVTFYSRHQGLPQDYVYSLMQDKKNYLWIGTGNGLARFDGKTFLHYRTTNGLREDFITSSTIYPDGTRLFSHFNGDISSYYNGIFAPLTALPPSNTSINKIFLDKRESLWAGTREGEVFFFNKKNEQIKRWNLAEYESVNFIDSLRGDQLLVATDAAIYRFKWDLVSTQPTFTKYQVPDSSGIRSISRIDDKSWLVYTQESQLYLVTFKGDQPVFSSLNETISKDIKFVQALANNRFWVFTNTGKWIEYKKMGDSFAVISTVSHIDIPTQLVPNVLYEDNEGNIWIGTFGSGLLKFSLKRSTFYSLGTNLELKVNAMLMTSPKSILVATNKGLFQSTKDLARFEKLHNKIASQGIISICQIEENVFLVATESSKLYKWYFQNDVWKEWPLPLTEQDKIRQVTTDKAGNIWIATSTGALLFERTKNKFKILTMEDGMAHNYVYAIFTDSKDRVWFATHKSGLSYYNNNKVTTIKSPLENTGLDINCFTEDKEGNIWIGTSGQGVFIINKRGDFVKSISSADGLVSDHVYFFQKDLSKSVWIGHKNGLDRVLRIGNSYLISDYSQYLGNKELSQSNYSMLAGNDIWLGGTNSCIRLNVNPENKSPEGSFVDISDLKLNYDNINWAERHINYNNEIPDYINFKYSENLLTFSFSGISFSYNDKLRYQYKLEGFDDKWSLLTEQNFVTYNKLPPGSYTFLVKSRNYAGIWSPHPTELHFTILPPYWETWWFRMLAVLLIVSTIYIVIKVRTANLKRRNEVLEIEKIKLEKEINERKLVESKLLKSELSLRNTNQELNTLIYRASHDLRGPVSTISGLVNVAHLRVQDAESISFFNMINTSVDKLDQILKKLFLVSEIKQSDIQPDVFDVVDVVKEVLESLKADIKAKEFHTSIENTMKRPFCTDKKIVETIVRNLLDNSLTYFRKNEREIAIFLGQEDKNLVIKVVDNGKGIRAEHIEKVMDMFYKASDLSKGNGLGLYIVKNAVHLLKGEITIKSKENEFTSVEIHIPEYTY